MHQPVHLDTIGALAEYRHGLACYCPRCRRVVDLDLADLVRRGHGDRPVVGLVVRCAVCGTRGEKQIRVPVDAWPTHLRRTVS